MSIKNTYQMKRGWMEHYLFKGAMYSQREAWCWLIENAGYKHSRMRHKNTVVTLGRGEVPTSYRRLAEKWQWSVNRVRRFLDVLESEQMIARKTDTGFLIVSICNYENFQFDIKSADTQTDTVTDTVTDTQADTNIKKEKEKEEKRINKGGKSRRTQAKKIPLEVWEEKNGKFSKNHVLDFAEEYRIPDSELFIMIDRFRSACFASDYRYVNFPQTFRNWNLEKVKDKKKASNNGMTPQEVRELRTLGLD